MVRLLTISWIFLAAVALAAYLLRPGNEYILGLAILLTVAVLIPILKEQLRRKREGFYVSKSGNADGGDLVYHEGDRLLTFYFDRTAKTVYVPSHRKWEEEMPGWANTRRLEIMERIRNRVGANWRLEDKVE